MKSPLVVHISVCLAFAFTSLSALSQVTTSSYLARESYEKLPLSFEPNRGQTDPSVPFLAHGLGYTLFLRPGEALLAMRSAGLPTGDQKPLGNEDKVTSAATGESHPSLIRMRLIGANPHAWEHAEDPLITRSNYFLGKDPAKWRTGVPNYGRVRFGSVYEGIDLVYYGNQRRLEHDFVIAPHANAASIVLAFDPLTHPSLDPRTGDLVLLRTGGSPQADLRLDKPYAYQESHGKRSTVPSSYKLLSNGQVGFAVGPYNHALPLVIDPVLTYSTYLGGTGGDQGNGIAVDTAGDAYVVGTTYSTDFPVTTGAFQTKSQAASGASTVFVSKLNPTGTALLYSTYLGGSGGDMGYGIALDSSGNAYITGATYSTDFPVTCNAFQVSNPSTTTGAAVGFVAKLDSSGSVLLYSTYLGGQGNQNSPAEGDVSQAIAVNASGNAYVTGYTYSSDFPTMTGAFQVDFKGNASNSNAFVAELNPDATALVYSTYLGGSGTTIGALSSAVSPGD